MQIAAKARNSASFEMSKFLEINYVTMENRKALFA